MRRSLKRLMRLTQSFLILKSAKRTTSLAMLHLPLALVVARLVKASGEVTAQQAGKPWLHATLAIGQRDEPASPLIPGEAPRRPGLTASGMFLINPPHTLKPALAEAMPQLLEALGRGRGKAQSLESGG